MGFRGMFEVNIVKRVGLRQPPWGTLACSLSSSRICILVLGGTSVRCFLVIPLSPESLCFVLAIAAVSSSMVNFGSSGVKRPESAVSYGIVRWINGVILSLISRADRQNPLLLPQKYETLFSISEEEEEDFSASAIFRRVICSQ